MYRQSIQFPIKDSALREDVHALGELIGETLRDQGGEDFFRLVEGDRLAAIQQREANGAGGAELEERTMSRSPSAISTPVARPPDTSTSLPVARVRTVPP